MRCPYCKHSESKVIDTRKYPHFIKRQRLCAECKRVYPTIESIEKQGME